jgi:hypothetical protein
MFQWVNGNWGSWGGFPHLLRQLVGLPFSSRVSWMLLAEFGSRILAAKNC